MGNVPTKLEDDRPVRSGRSVSVSATTSGGNGGAVATRTHRASSLVGNLLTSRSRSNSGFYSANPYKRKSTKEKEKLKEKHARQLVVKYNETVDGGFLAPYGCCSIEKLDYDAKVVRSLIIDRKLAPFYTPLQDFDDSWSVNEVVKIVDGLPLHASFTPELEEFEGVPIGDLSNPDFDYLIDKTLSRREQRRMRSKIFNARLYQKRIIWQENENERFLEQKLEAKNHTGTSNQYLPNDSLKYDMYKQGAECPICFLYFPEPMNVSRCCLQPICTECFIQIRRAEPHFPHDENDSDSQDENKDPNLLISEPANCPYCATPNFGVTYEPLKERRTGIQGPSPASYVHQEPVKNDESSVTGKRRGSLAAGHPQVITSDAVRPEWQVKLTKERMRLARRSANATAIHVSNQLVVPNHDSQSPRGLSISPRDVTISDSPNTWTSTNAGDIENQMIEQAIKLSLADQKEQKKRRHSAK